VAHTYNPSYPRGRDQEDLGSNPTGANNSRDPILKKPYTKKSGKVTQSVDPEFKLQYYEKKMPVSNKNM
jgi:hypothetical protein